MLDDGPEPTGLRYCVSGVAMKLVPENEEDRQRANELRQTAKVSPMDLSTADWRLVLTPAQFRITRLRVNEEPFSSGLEKMDLEEKGIFRCVCCESPLFCMSTKFDSGCGWPSFTAPISRRKGGTVCFK